MMNKIFLFLFLLSRTYICAGQFSTDIRSSRPGQAVEPFAVGRGILQFQNGVDFRSFKDGPVSNRTYLSNNVIRYGIIENLEINAQLDHSSHYMTLQDNTTSLKGFSALHTGINVHTWDQQGILPATALMAKISFPASSNFNSDLLGSEFGLLSGWSLPNSIGITANYIFSFGLNNSQKSGRYILNIGFPIAENWSGFIENYGLVDHNRVYTYFDAGIAYLLKSNLQLDL